MSHTNPSVRPRRGVNRRGAMRKPPRGKVKAECRIGPFGLGRNVARDLIDISQTGCLLILHEAVEAGSEVELALLNMHLIRPVKRSAVVIRCEPAEDGGYLTAVRFHKAIDYRDFYRLT